MICVDDIINIAEPLCLEVPRQKKHISLIFHKKRLISVGANYFKTHPKAQELGYQFDEMHSELDAYRKLPRNMKKKKLTLVNIRMNSNKELRISRPCEICEGWCVEVFDKIYYTDNEGFKKLL
jgi:hypothetical protein